MLDCSRNPPRSRHVVGRFGHGVVTSVLGPGYPYSDPSGPTACHSARLGHHFAETGQMYGLVSGRSDSAALAIVIPVSLHPCLPMIYIVGLALSQHTKTAGAIYMVFLLCRGNQEIANSNFAEWNWTMLWRS